MGKNDNGLQSSVDSYKTFKDDSLRRTNKVIK